MRTPNPEPLAEYRTYFAVRQLEALRRICALTGIPIAVLIRRSVDATITRYNLDPSKLPHDANDDAPELAPPK